jgi:hypothetical protein
MKRKRRKYLHGQLTPPHQNLLTKEVSISKYWRWVHQDSTAVDSMSPSRIFDYYGISSKNQFGFPLSAKRNRCFGNMF